MKKVNPIPNSKPFEKGQSGNPNGRPKKLPALDEIGAALLSEEKGGMNALEAILKGMIAKAVKGDTQAAKLIIERFYGQAKQPVEHSGEIAHTGNVQFVFETGGETVFASEKDVIEDDSSTDTD